MPMKVFAPPHRFIVEGLPKELMPMITDQRAEYLVQAYSDDILRLSYTYLNNMHDAQDVCQTVLLKLLTLQRDFPGTREEKAYILKMTANACKDFLRSPWRKRTCDLETCAEMAAPEAPDSAVLDAVNSLPERYRAVIHLFYYCGYRADEIGKILGIPTATVHTRLARGRAKLKDLLGGFDDE